MTAEELHRVFRAFSQGDHATERSASQYGGLGLGLAISRNLVELQRGSISAASSGRGLGATFTIELPLIGAAARVEEEPPPSPEPMRTVGRPALTNGAGRILLVEDHEDTRAALARLLRRRGFEVALAGSAAEARALANQQTFDLLISDIGLPDGDGFELMSDLRGRGLKGIALTGYGMETDVERSRQAGFLAHLTKPIRIVTLDRVLAEAAQAPASSEPV